MNEKLAGVLALIVTFCFFSMIGLIPFKFISYLSAIVLMYLYVTSKNIDNVWVKFFGFISVLLGLGYWRHQSTKEGFFVSPLKHISSSITARQCQDICQSSTECKYAQVPVGSSKTGQRTHCWNSYGFRQFHWGSKGSGGDTWQNSLFKEPITHNGSWSGRAVTTGRRAQVVELKTDWLWPMLKVKEINLTARLRDQGWGNPTWGIYIVGRDVNGRTVFKEVVKAPRSKRTIRYTQCYGAWFWRRCYRRSKSVMGPRRTNSVSDTENNNTPVRSLRVYAYTRGQGHSLDVDYVRWTVQGFPA